MDNSKNKVAFQKIVCQEMLPVMRNMSNMLTVIFISFLTNLLQAQQNNVDNLPVREHHISIDKKMVKYNGKEKMGMAINSSIPGPTLEFKEGEYAVIHVTNKMKMETSIHWHGLLLPNFQDGVPYLTTPPIQAGETFTYEFPIRQSGTYWYHSHTMLQEQSGVYGSIVIHPKEEKYEVDKELVIMLSDWTNEKPMAVLKNLKRRNEWYQIEKGTAVPLSRVIVRGAFGSQLKMWRDRMEGADIADIAYDAFLSNGKEILEYPDLQPGEKVRVRIINGAASTIFWMSFGGNIPTMIANDGIDVVPVKRDKLLFAIAETYDFIFEIPESGKLEIKAYAQDGSGSTSTYLGSGNLHPAPDLLQPDKVKIMQDMAKMDMKMGAPALISNPKKVDPQTMMEKYGMKMDHSMHNMPMDEMGHNEHEENEMEDEQMGHQMHQQEEDEHKEHKMHEEKVKPEAHEHHMEEDMQRHEDHTNKNHHQAEMNHQKHEQKEEEQQQHHQMQHNEPRGHKMEQETHVMGGTYDYDEAMTYANYDYLKAKEVTAYDDSVPVNEILLNLTGNMNRYVWSMNGIPLSEADNIKIEGKEVTRITLNNMTMMHHPMHLHGHFFRVINKNGDYSPLKHTVNVPPMEKITIEFYGGEESGDWFFHCHVLYHMMGGMTRIFSYETPRDPRMQLYSAQTIINETDHTFNWNTAETSTQMAEVDFIVSNMRNEWNITGEYDYDENLEAEATYNRYINSFVRLFGGVNVENEHNSLDEFNPVGVVGMKYFTPYMFLLDLRVDHQLRPQIGLERELMIFPRTFFEGEINYQLDFGAINDIGSAKYDDELEWSTGVEFMINRDFSLKGNYHNQYGWGAGLVTRF